MAFSIDVKGGQIGSDVAGDTNIYTGAGRGTASGSSGIQLMQLAVLATVLLLAVTLTKRK